jgi:hypothetical protein
MAVITALRELTGHMARFSRMSAENFYSLTIRTENGSRVARFDRLDDAMAAYENARLDGAISAALDRVKQTPDGVNNYRIAELA